jgi:hypothetical protein
MENIYWQLMSQAEKISYIRSPINLLRQKKLLPQGGKMEKGYRLGIRKSFKIYPRRSTYC